jgi:hypothetical protein
LILKGDKNMLNGFFENKFNPNREKKRTTKEVEDKITYKIIGMFHI